LLTTTDQWKNCIARLEIWCDVSWLPGVGHFG
jgi:hypothetical protein